MLYLLKPASFLHQTVLCTSILSDCPSIWTATRGGGEGDVRRHLQVWPFGTRQGCAPTRGEQFGPSAAERAGRSPHHWLLEKKGLRRQTRKICCGVFTIASPMKRQHFPACSSAKGQSASVHVTAAADLQSLKCEPNWHLDRNRRKEKVASGVFQTPRCLLITLNFSLVLIFTFAARRCYPLD